MFLTRRLGVLALLSAAAPLAVPRAPLLALAAVWLVLSAATVSDAVRAPRPGSVVVGRERPDVARVGEPYAIGLRLTNGTRRAWPVAVRDATPPSLAASPARIETVLRPGASRATYEVQPRRRGRFLLGPVTVRVTGPAGLAGRQATVGIRSELKVYPDLPGQRQVRGRLRRGRLLEAGVRSARVRGGGMEFESLREYHPDDEFRAINWRASSRATTLITNVYREERNQRLLLLLDSGRTMAGSVAGTPRFELALDAAVAVASVAAGIGDRVGGAVFDERIRAAVAPGSGAAQVTRLLDAMFDVEPAIVASDYRGVLGSVLGRYRRRAMVVVFTDVADEGALDSLVNALPQLTRRHLVVVAQVADPETERLARLVPVDAEGAFRKAAAAAASARRERAAARLLRLGATVVDEPPGRLAPAVADAYLRVKAYGRL